MLGEPVRYAVPPGFVAGEPVGHPGGLCRPVGEGKLRGFGREQVDQPQLQPTPFGVRGVEVRQQRVDRRTLDPLVDARHRVHNHLCGGAELAEGRGGGAEHRDRQVTQLGRDLVPEHGKGLLVVCRDQHPPAVGDEMTHEVRDRVALARARRALHRHPTGPFELAGDALLLVVGGQRHQQPPPERAGGDACAVTVVGCRGRARAAGREPAGVLVVHDRGERFRQHVTLGENLPELGVEPLVERWTGADEQHPGVHQHGRGRRRRDLVGQRAPPAEENPGVEAQRGDDLPVHLGQPVLAPQVRRARPDGVAQCAQLLERGDPQPVQRVGLDSGIAVRQHAQVPVVGIQLDRQGGDEQRMIDKMLTRRPGQNAVPPHQFVGGAVPGQPQPQVVQPLVEQPGGPRGTGGVRPWLPLLRYPGGKLGPQALWVLTVTCAGLLEIRWQRRRVGQIDRDTRQVVRQPGR